METLRERVLIAIKKKGTRGIAVTELANQLKTTPDNVLTALNADDLIYEETRNDNGHKRLFLFEFLK